MRTRLVGGRRPFLTRGRIIGLVSVTAVGAAALIGVAPTAAAEDPTPVVGTTPTWSKSLNDSGKEFYFGSPGVGILDDDGPALIVGNQQGLIYAFHASDGSAVDGWPHVGTRSIQSTPSFDSVTGLVFVGTGVSTSPSHGGYLAIKPNGTTAWFKQPYLLPDHRGGTRGVMSSLAVGPIQTTSDVVGGAMGQEQWAINAATGKSLKGFPWLQADTNFSTPAIANVSAGVHDEIIEGGDSTKGISGIQTYQNGGHIRILGHQGSYGKKHPNSGLVCQYNTNQVVQSSPAVGGFLADGANGIVVGTGSYFKKVSDSHKLIAINTSCKKQWSVTLDGNSHPSPAIADVDGDGTLDVITNSESGDVWALNGADGSVKWKVETGYSTIGSITTFQAPGADFQWILVPTNHGVDVLDGRDGSEVEQFGTDVRMLNSAAVTADPDGQIGITIAGMGPGGSSKIEHFVVTDSSDVTTVQTYGSWPLFHHDPGLTGFAPAIS